MSMRMEELAADINKAIDLDAGDRLTERYNKPPPTAAVDAEAWFKQTDGVLLSLRKRMLDQDIDHTTQRAALLHAAMDKLRRLDREHEERMARLKAMLDRLEALRDA